MKEPLAAPFQARRRSTAASEREPGSEATLQGSSRGAHPLLRMLASRFQARRRSTAASEREPGSEATLQGSSRGAHPLLRMLAAPFQARRRSTAASEREPGSEATLQGSSRGAHPLLRMLTLRQLISAAAGEDRKGRLEEDRDVEPDRPVLDVVEVEPHEVVEREVRAARDLPQARDSRQHEIALAVPRLELVVVAQRQGSRADQAHLAGEHVQYLGQLVERELPQEAADAGDARVLADLEESSRRLVVLFERHLLLGSALHHRPELEHPELATGDPDPPVAVEHGPARVELDGQRDQEPDRETDDDDDAADHEVEGALDEPVGPGEHGRPQLEQGRSLTRHVLASLNQELRRLGGEANLHTRAVRRLDDLEHGRLVEVALGEDQLVRPGFGEDRGEPLERAELLEAGRRPRPDGADEVVRHSTARGDERPMEAGDVVTPTDEDGPAANAEDPLQLDDDRVVRRAQRPDRERAHHTRGRQQAVGRELVTVAERERDRHGGDEDERREDAAEPGPPLALGVQSGVPEHEQRDRDQEREPLPSAVAPQQSPVDGLVEEERTQDERAVETERKTGDVEQRQHRDPERPAHECAERQAREQIRPRGADVLAAEQRRLVPRDGVGGHGRSVLRHQADATCAKGLDEAVFARSRARASWSVATRRRPSRTSPAYNAAARRRSSRSVSWKYTCSTRSSCRRTAA